MTSPIRKDAERRAAGVSGVEWAASQTDASATLKQIAKIIDAAGEGPAKVSGSKVMYTTGMGESAYYTVRSDGTIVNNIGGEERTFKNVAAVKVDWSASQLSASDGDDETITSLIDIRNNLVKASTSMGTLSRKLRDKSPSASKALVKGVQAIATAINIVDDLNG